MRGRGVERKKKKKKGGGGEEEERRKEEGGEGRRQGVKIKAGDGDQCVSSQQNYSVSFPPRP